MNPANHKLIKAPQKKKKGENKEQNGRTHFTEDIYRPPKRANNKGTIKFSNPPPVMRSISNNERGEKKEPMRENPSPSQKRNTQGGSLRGKLY